jgi:hypothetical protein
MQGADAAEPASVSGVEIAKILHSKWEDRDLRFNYAHRLHSQINLQ